MESSRDKDIAASSDGTEDIGSQIDRTSRDLETLMEEAASLSDELSSDPGTALAVVEGTSPAAMKQHMAQVRATVMKKQQEIVAKQAELKSLLERKMSEVQLVVQPLTAMVKRLEEGIWTANLYLGQDEEFVQLRDGVPADATTPITVRQLVLAMDEECAVAAEKGGIDAMDIPTFDAWLTADPKNLAQVFPEPRGVVALVPRWSEKEYGNPWEDAARNTMNRQTYFLIRNGERLYRYVTDFIAGQRLIPAASEFTDFFYQRSFFGEERRPLEPGSSEWRRAEEKADARKRHYMRVGLILQGLVDRTGVFAPLEKPVRFLEPDDYDAGRIVIVTDGDRMLDDGREPFRVWQRRLMREVRPGMRIVGAFNAWDSREAWHIHPKNASLPASLVPHLITERVSGGALKFTYERTDELWGWHPVPGRPGQEQWGSRKATQRASCRFADDETLVLPLDLITLEEIDYYLRSRRDRHEYLEMFPLLKAAQRIKSDEATQEASFRDLLASVMSKELAMPLDEALAVVPEMVEWWKFTNRNHRPLVGAPEENTKALHMIVAEYRRRLKDQRRQLNGALVKELKKRYPNALVIARRRDDTYIVLEPQDDGDTFVRESVWSATGRFKSSEEWCLVGPRPSRWTIAYQSAAFATWNTMADIRYVFREPEILEVAEKIVATCRAKGEVVVSVMVTDGTHGDKRRSTWISPVLLENANAVTDPYYWAQCREHPLTKGATRVSFQSRGYNLVRNGDGSVSYQHEYWSDRYPTGIAWPVWEPSGPYAGSWRRVWLDENVAQQAHEARRRAEQLAELVRPLQQRVEALERGFASACNEIEEQRLFEKFVEEYRDPDLWEGHRKTLKVHPVMPGLRDFGHVQYALMLLVETGNTVNGFTAQAVLDAAKELSGYEGEVPERLRAHGDVVFEEAREA